MWQSDEHFFHKFSILGLGMTYDPGPMLYSQVAFFLRNPGVVLLCNDFVGAPIYGRLAVLVSDPVAAPRIAPLDVAVRAANAAGAAFHTALIIHLDPVFFLVPFIHPGRADKSTGLMFAFFAADIIFGYGNMGLLIGVVPNQV